MKSPDSQHLLRVGDDRPGSDMKRRWRSLPKAAIEADWVDAVDLTREVPSSAIKPRQPAISFIRCSHSRLLVFSIHSTSSTRELVFSAHKDEFFRVEIKGFEVSASADVWAYTDANGLNEFFQELGHLEKRWQGQRSWASIDREFSLAATCTSLGKVTFRVTLLGLQGAPEEWRVEAGLVTDFGQLKKIAKHAGVFFNE